MHFKAIRVVEIGSAICEVEDGSQDKNLEPNYLSKK
jgi:hypothetical protein